MAEYVNSSGLKDNEKRVTFWQATAMVSLLFMVFGWLAAVSAESACHLEVTRLLWH